MVSPKPVGKKPINRRKSCLSAAVLVLLAIFSTTAMGQYGQEVGREVVDTCLSEQRAMRGDLNAAIRYGLCLGYLKGVADAFQGREFCMPEISDTHQLVQMLRSTYLEYARNHRADIEKDALQSILPALKKAFPCTDGNIGK